MRSILHPLTWFDVFLIFTALMCLVEAFETHVKLRRAEWIIARYDRQLDVIEQSAPYYGPVETVTPTLYDQDEEPSRDRAHP